ncbi:class I SAM-dependent methyltransferase [Deinococcus radiodurans]|uniref:Methyltransferase type 11 domain-containing protein n=1 Tax=Deinococcus radiodurans (strain ATCC 13939 / DSM 20539 / JCM 16871 / CCUG 27074 / LMG 4051 / NBRC 15346 / NCIMB 9279 / VKM B-1422 / R1) TaxID=243230 RepID=Q9RVC8_DEIRA|nr:class I SAM-dependent methyltransferase [Deinococcus radiodurans]AAF10675.1 conserved hypothetical protein [Deinococcus radiodurans R1 = ATCC 13939 = DSM 20539]ANC71720.1 methyltransferase type 11 [Deinococcus radiodurans R1 = ATCC 13939 = DSM 20539]QEM70585.1 SAM-dependent methyltransferase [Deinococcus radiodurans]QIP29189.1 methyltransferase domain-containing protein [Deinococcus radiodurans]QIP32115.1 methyltransferase domain-containing protein [Deinococcus radiodurans]
MSTAPKPTVQNPFASADAAGRYAAGRPAFHLLVLSRLAPHLTGRELGADVACGTGLSSAALAELVGEVRAFDASAAMLAEAAPHPRVTYAQAPAEALPLADGVLDVMTVAQAFHWFDHAAFLAEARRTLKPGGVLALYDDFFLGEMEGEPNFGTFAKTYLARYPTPARHRDPFGETEAQAAGFTFHEETWKHPLALTQPQLVAYLLTHSNTLAATENGTASQDEIAEWLNEQLAPFYAGGGTRNVVYGALLTVLRREG